ncbi:hypothetical protein SAMN02745166_02232 [Prosthecobacter debontii]|uniref:HipA-like kinase domain-containing protein n=1 Tax=Prosthecobacter debontii TaxID=48467 RepID=A0A1T4Y098_9BACT|nr:HipA family kinase [Prosthecobacter debontii]SKA94888.1 hypothetical protein SAMN02745166_02232 [Prosthecobacter debontii]
MQHETQPTEESIRITEIQGRETSSILRPLECRASDGNRYFIKTRRSDKNPLLCEWVCSKLAQALELPCPPVCIAWLPKELLDESNHSDYDLVAGWSFGSLAVDFADTFPKAVANQIPDDLRLRVLAFDHWIHNSDRRDQNPNLLWQAREKQLWLIDHHLTLSPDPVRKSSDTHIFREDWNTCWGNNNADEIIEWLRGGLDELDGIFAAIPPEWLNAQEDFLTKTRALLTRRLP